METILILTTGGTIDKVYFDAKSAYEVGPPNISTLLAELNLSISYRIVSVMRKDSLDLTDDDRQLIYDQAVSSDETRILITHGTDTMVDTARERRQTFADHYGIEKTCDTVETVLIALDTDAGITGWGEVCPIPHYLPAYAHGVEPAIRDSVFHVMQLDPTRPAMVDGGNALRDESLPVNGAHYTEFMNADFRDFPDAAYTREHYYDPQRPHHLDHCQQ